MGDFHTTEKLISFIELKKRWPGATDDIFLSLVTTGDLLPYIRDCTYWQNQEKVHELNAWNIVLATNCLGEINSPTEIEWNAKVVFVESDILERFFNENIHSF